MFPSLNYVKALSPLKVVVYIICAVLVTNIKFLIQKVHLSSSGYGKICENKKNLTGRLYKKSWMFVCLQVREVFYIYCIPYHSLFGYKIGLKQNTKVNLVIITDRIFLRAFMTCTM